MRTIEQPAPLERPKPSTLPERLAVHSLYTSKTLLQLFMVCAFPLHLWALLMAFRDFGWVALRTTAWDALGLVSYALLVALLESLAVFGVTLLAGLLLPWNWSPEKRFALLGMLFLVLAGWSILGKLMGMYGYPIPEGALRFLQGSGHPLRWVWGMILPLVVISILLPAAAFIRSRRFQASLPGLLDRLVLLSSLYVGLDVIGIVIIVLRNILPRLEGS